MSIFMLIGKFGCPTFATAEYFARHLTTLVPSVRMKSQAFTEDDYEVILSKMRGVLHCEHTGSPLIWRDLEQIGMCPTYIGGASEFFDFCKEYYDIVMPFNSNHPVLIEEEFMKEHARDTLKIAKEKVNETAKRICITGAGNPAASLLLLELIQDKLLYTDNYLEIRLHEGRKDLVEKLEPMIWDIEGVECPDLCKRIVVKCDHLYDAIKGCNLLIIMSEIKRKDNEIYESWLMNNYNMMKDLAECIDEVEIVSIKVIITSIQLLCFNTAVLLKHSKILDPLKTIAITSHLGLEALQYIANLSKLSPGDVFGSPVWGYIGINQVVDLCHTKCLYRKWEIRKKPRKNPLKKHLQSHTNFTGPPPIVIEKRDLCFRTHTCDLIWQWVNSYKTSVKNIMGCYPYMSQVNATMHVINLWLCNDFNKEILPVGIQSNGSYDIPSGIVFSQPVTLENGKWIIYSKLPLPHYQISLRCLFPLPLIISKKFSLVSNLPRVEDFFLPLKKIEPAMLNIIEQQKHLRAKRAAMLHNKNVTHSEEDNEDDEEKKAKEKNQLMEDLKNLRKEMKEIVESNPYNWYTKKTQKMKSEMEQEAIKEETDVAPDVKTDVPRESKLDDVDKTEKERVEEEIRILDQTTSAELISEIEKLDLVKDLGIVYGNKIRTRFEEKKTKEENLQQKPKSTFLKQYRVICEAEKKYE